MQTLSSSKLWSLIFTNWLCSRYYHGKI